MFAEAWYRDVLGFVVRANAPFRWPGSESVGRWLTVSVKHDSRIIVVLAPARTPAERALVGAMPPVTIKSTQLSSLHDRLRLRGADVTPVTTIEWGTSFVVRDPSGNPWSVMELP